MKLVTYYLVPMLCVFVLAVGSQPVRGQCADVDGDGYCSVASGGDDCYDSLMSKYKEGPGCRESSQPTFMRAPDVPGTESTFADHTWIRGPDGTYHVFAMNYYAPPASCPPKFNSFFRHFVSTNLRDIALADNPVALDTSVSGFDKDGLWAPHVVEHDGLYYMFYTGSDFAGSDCHNAATTQQIGLAVSGDLETWVRRPEPVYSCDADYTLVDLDDPRDFLNSCRDPFVIYDETQGRWLMFVTSLLNPAKPDGSWYNWSEGIVVAEASCITGPWTHLGLINATRTLRASQGGILGQLPGGGASENPFVTEYNGEFFLFFKDYNDPQAFPPAPIQSWIQYAKASTLDADEDGSLNWTYMGYTPEPGLNAPEVINHEGDTWILSAAVWNCNCVSCGGCAGGTPSFADLIFKRMIWNPDGTFATKNLTNPLCRVPSAAINPGATEVCIDGIDNNCDGQADNEVCGDDLDNDCDGRIDEGCGGGCFPAGVRVTMADGSTRSIESLLVGDRVLSYEEDTRSLAVGEVVKTFSHDPPARLITINGTLRATPNHEVHTGDRWMSVGALDCGHVLTTLDHVRGASMRGTASQATVFSVEHVSGAGPVYNIEVGGAHNYFAEGVLVHNKPPIPKD